MTYADAVAGAAEARESGPSVVLVAAVARNGVIGRDGDLPWHLPGDLAHFKRVTSGHVVLMGRRTFESIGRPLPKRENVVVTSRTDWQPDGVHVCGSVEEALARSCELATEMGCDVMVIGGAQIYAATMAEAGAQVLTEVHQSPDGDVTYPEFDREAWRETDREGHDGFDVVRLERIG